MSVKLSGVGVIIILDCMAHMMVMVVKFKHRMQELTRRICGAPMQEKIYKLK